MSHGMDSLGFVRLLKEQACWANVCTEPGMVAFMASRAASLLGEPAVEIEVCLSSGVLKNALSAGLPHTSVRGPGVAAAAGAIACRPDQGLTILGSLTQDQMGEALRLVQADRVTIKWDAGHDGVYGECTVRGEKHVAQVVVEGSHTNVTEERLDGRVVSSAVLGPEESGISGLAALKGWTFERLLETVMSIETSELEWLLEGARSCYGLAQVESQENYPSAQLPSPEACAALSRDESPVLEASGRTFRAILARMSGRPWPVLTSGGSGNQGLMVSIPLMSLFETLGVKDEVKTRALAIAHGVNMLVKAYTGEISSSCGGVSAGAGLAAAVCWLLGGTRQQMADAATEVLASLCGMVCDGAKETCALKGSLAVMTGLVSGTGSVHFDHEIQDQGVVGRSIDETLTRLEALNRRVLAKSDAVLLEMAGVPKG